MSLAHVLLAIIISSLLILAASANQQPQPIRKHKKHAVSMSREFLAAHNNVRVRNGARRLIWDRRLALYARRWAKKRMSDCKLIHSYGSYGENIFWGGSNHWTPTEIVEKWVEENKFFNAERNECQQGEMCGHYTQVLWRDTLRLGCGKARCNDGGVYVVCTYDPPGNFENEGPFGGSNDDSNTPPPPSSHFGLLPPPPLF